jgi:hypothetical protein
MVMNCLEIEIDDLAGYRFRIKVAITRYSGVAPLVLHQSIINRDFLIWVLHGRTFS